MHPGPLPPLGPVPDLDRLLAPDEKVLYTARLHPLYGAGWLLVGLLGVVGGLWLKPLWPLAAVALMVYALPFRHFQLAVTTQRLLVKRGRFAVELDAILGHQLGTWHLRQSLPQAALRAGTVTITYHHDGAPCTLTLPWLWHPMSFLEALETLQMTPHHG